MSSELKIKNQQPDGQRIRVQFWDGSIPTYDSEKQRREAQNRAVQAVDIDAAPAESEGEKLPEGYDKLKKDELIALANARKEAGKEITLEETDTVKILREKIEATYPAPAESEGDEDGEEDESPVIDPQYSFGAQNLLQEQVLDLGEEKVFAVSGKMFITIKIDA